MWIHIVAHWCTCRRLAISNHHSSIIRIIRVCNKSLKKTPIKWEMHFHIKNNEFISLPWVKIEKHSISNVSEWQKSNKWMANLLELCGLHEIPIIGMDVRRDLLEIHTLLPIILSDFDSDIISSNIQNTKTIQNLKHNFSNRTHIL